MPSFCDSIKRGKLKINVLDSETLAVVASGKANKCQLFTSMTNYYTRFAQSDITCDDNVRMDSRPFIAWINVAVSVAPVCIYLFFPLVFLLIS